MLATIAATMVLTTVVGGLISVFWMEARHGLHDGTPDKPTPAQLHTAAWSR